MILIIYLSYVRKSKNSKNFQEWSKVLWIVYMEGIQFITFYLKFLFFLWVEHVKLCTYKKGMSMSNYTYHHHLPPLVALLFTLFVCTFIHLKVHRTNTAWGHASCMENINSSVVDNVAAVLLPCHLKGFTLTQLEYVTLISMRIHPMLFLQ